MWNLSFTDYLFLPLFLLLAVLYYLIPRKGQWVLLLVASILFYCSYGIELLPFAGLAIVCAYVGALVMQRRNDALDARIKETADISRDEKRTLQAQTKQGNKRILWLVVFCIAGVLVYTKVQRRIEESVIVSAGSWIYVHLCVWGRRIPVIQWFVQDAEAGTVIGARSLVVPLGISYYTMSLVGYLADVYWRKERAERNILRLALFTLYFPKILEGPISRHKRLAPQFEAPHAFDYPKFCHGLQRMAWGYFKKLCIADRLSRFVTPVFADYHSYGGSVILVAAVFCAFQLYCDFSGCMDIALGASHALGIEMEENFDHPFSARTAAEFWRRWHISLGTWFKDYIYMPIVISPRLMQFVGLCSKRVNKRFGKAVMSIVPLVVVWLFTGLWHGTGWNYVIWGIWWGFLIIVGTVFEPEFKRLTTFLHIDKDSTGFVVFQQLRTFAFFVIGRIITSVKTPGDIVGVLHWMVVRFEPWHLVDQSMYEYGLNRQNLWLVIALMVFLMVVEHGQQKGTLSAAVIDGKPLVMRWAIYLCMIYVTLVFGIYGAGYDASAFVYMNY